MRPDRDTAQVIRRLRAAGVPVSDAPVDRAAYSSDASLYRVVPAAIAFPRDADQVAACVRLGRDHGVPVTARGAGTSIAGNAVGPGLVLDLSRHLDTVQAIDPEGRTATVAPGVVLADLQRAVARWGLRFGPDPSTASRCTVGGMIGNDACGTRSLQVGRTSANVLGLQLVTGTGEVIRTHADPLRATDFDGAAAVNALVDENLATIRREFGRFPRQVSGYALSPLLPEHGRNLTRALVGSEGTLGIVTSATVRLLPEPRHRVLVILGFADLVAAAAATPAVLRHGPSACEGMDARIVEVVRARRGPDWVPGLPAGRAWLFVELSADDPDEAAVRAAELAADHENAVVVTDPVAAQRLWRIREDGAGLSGRAPSGRPAWPGWEDAAVPVAALAAYLAEFEELLADSGLSAMPYGHFGEGCVHVRIDFPFDRDDGVRRFRTFLTAAADLVARHGGSMSGEHGDGRARGALLPAMYSPAALQLFARLKRVFDPDGVLNPGVGVDPAPAEVDLRPPQARNPLPRLAFAYSDDDGQLAAAVHRCTGVGRCRDTRVGSETVMCPSFAATRDEKDSTRGRARVLQELANGDLVHGWRSPAVTDALDLCLSCKGCLSDCPTGVDMATYKSEALHQAWRGRLRPRSHYLLGRLPQWAALAARAPQLANTLLGAPGLAAAAGIDPRRSLPRFAPQTFRAWFRRQPAVGGTPVQLFVDTFTDHFAPEVGRAAVDVLHAAGYAPIVSAAATCCALTQISTGQLDQARRRLTRTIGLLDRELPVVGLEPSCTAVLRRDAVELLDSAAARRVAAATGTLAELLTGTAAWQPPSLTGTTVLAQPHCHHHAVLGWQTDADLLAAAGAQVRRLGGCCGLAGNFGMERGHYDVSVAVAGLQLLPGLDAPADVVLADGFSCRTQIADLTRHRGRHLAQLLADPPDAGAAAAATTTGARPAGSPQVS